MNFATNTSVYIQEKFSKTKKVETNIKLPGKSKSKTIQLQGKSNSKKILTDLTAEEEQIKENQVTAEREQIKENKEKRVGAVIAYLTGPFNWAVFRGGSLLLEWTSTIE